MKPGIKLAGLLLAVFYLTGEGRSQQPHRVSMSWQTVDATEYHVYRGTSPSIRTLIAVVTSGTTWTDTSVQGGVTYYYDVRGANDAGEAPASNTAIATVPRDAAGGGC